MISAGKNGTGASVERKQEHYKMQQVAGRKVGARLNDHVSAAKWQPHVGDRLKKMKKEEIVETGKEIVDRNAEGRVRVAERRCTRYA